MDSSIYDIYAINGFGRLTPTLPISPVIGGDVRTNGCGSSGCSLSSSTCSLRLEVLFVAFRICSSSALCYWYSVRLRYAGLRLESLMSGLLGWFYFISRCVMVVKLTMGVPMNCG